MSEYPFHISKKPEFTKDLTNLEANISELSITGETKNIDRLKSFSNLQILWVNGLTQVQFNTIIGQVNPKLMYLYNVKAKDISLLAKLTNLETFRIEWNTKSDSLWDLTGNTSLKQLDIVDFKKLTDFSPLQKCPWLESLGLEGGVWNAIQPDTLKPLIYLKKLRLLDLINIKVKDESLEPIGHLKQLEKLRISNQFPTEEYARLSVALPNTECSHFRAYIKLQTAIDDKDVLVVGKRKPYLNSQTDSKKLKKYEEQFKDFQKKYMSALNGSE
jgi:hypothetical protein